MGAFVSQAAKKAGDIRAFLKEAAGGTNIKYKAQPNVQHSLYFPFRIEQELDEASNTMVDVARLFAISGSIHEWNDNDGHYHATICMKDFIRASEEDPNILLNDGCCPFCDRVQDGWGVYRYRMDVEEKTCTKTGKERESHMEAQKQNFLKERKASEARAYAYILVVQFRTTRGAGGSFQPILGKDGLPEFDLKVMKLSAKRAGDIDTQIVNSGMPGMAGSEIIIDYPDTEDSRQLVIQSRISPVFPDHAMVKRYPGLAERIQAEVEKFDFDGIDKSFQEWTGMTTSEAKKITEELFSNWDKYQHELKVDPEHARYMEYGLAASGPALGTPAAGIPAAGMGIPAGIPAGVPGVGIPGMGQPGGIPAGIPQAQPQQGAPQGVPQGMPQAAPQGVPQGMPQPGAPVGAAGIPGMPIPDPNQMFAQGIPGGDSGVKI